MAKSRRIDFGGVLVDYDDATREVRLDRTNADILVANPGDSMHCMNSNCIVRNRSVFPHPVYVASTLKSRVFIADAIDTTGNPTHVVRYELDERSARLIHDHDSHGVGVPGELVLRVPRDPKGSPKRRAAAGGGGFAEGAGHGNDPGARSTGERSRPITSDARGAAARYKVAVGAGLR